MIGIIDIALAPPEFKLTGQALAATWGGRSGGERALAAGDEDSLTLAIDAALRLVERGGMPAADGVFFASTSAPYSMKSNAAIAAEVCLASANATALDITGSTKAGLQALRVGLDFIGGGHPEHALVLAGERREARPASADELGFGDYGAALLIGHENHIAEYIGGFSYTEDFPDVWRSADAAYCSRADAKFVSDRGNARIAAVALKQALEHFDLKPEDIAYVALGLPASDSGKARAGLPFGADQYAGDDLAVAGDCGCVNALLRLAGALAQAEPGELVLAVAFGDGCEISLWRTTERISDWRAQGETAAAIAAGRAVTNYGTYLKSRELLGAETVDVFTSPVVLWREKDANVRRMAGKCAGCGLVTYPAPAHCPGCGGTEFSARRLGSRGEVVTFTVDHLPPSPGGSVIMAAADIEGGGRIYAQLVGCDKADVKVGMKVELTYRLLHKGGELRHYYWKLRPAR